MFFEIKSKDEFKNKIKENCCKKKVKIDSNYNIEKKNINEKFTQQLSKYFIETNNVFNFLKAVSELFSDIYDKERNPNNIGFIVFKGGNAIKYWSVRNILQKLNIEANKLPISEILKEEINIIDDDNNNYSDFDFSLYIDYNNLKISYSDILEKLYESIEKLRIRLNPLIVDHNNNINKDLISILSNNIFLSYSKNNLTLSKDVNNMFYTSDNNNNISYTLKENNTSMNIIFNNRLINEENDFDLFRIKLYFKYNYKKYNSEIFDLSIYRDYDQEFCNNVDKYSSIIDIHQFKKIAFKQTRLRIYNVKYLIIDLLKILFIEKNLPWTDSKYGKRLIRLALLYGSYIQENKEDFCIIYFTILNIIGYLKNYNNKDITINEYLFNIIKCSINEVDKYNINNNLPNKHHDVYSNILKIINDEELDISKFIDKPAEFISLIIISLIKSSENNSELIKMLKTFGYYLISGITMVSDYFSDIKIEDEIKLPLNNDINNIIRIPVNITGGTNSIKPTNITKNNISIPVNINPTKKLPTKIDYFKNYSKIKSRTNTNNSLALEIASPFVNNDIIPSNLINEIIPNVKIESILFDTFTHITSSITHLKKLSDMFVSVDNDYKITIINGTAYVDFIPRKYVKEGTNPHEDYDITAIQSSLKLILSISDIDDNLS